MRRFLKLKSSHLLKPNSIRFQLLSRTLLLIAMVLMIVGLSQYFLMKQFIYQNRAAGIQSQILSVPGEAWEEFSSYGDRPNRFRFFFLPETSLAFIDNFGNYYRLSDSLSGQQLSPRLSGQVYKEAMNSKLRLYYQVVTSSDGELLVVLQPVQVKGRPAGLVQVSGSTKPLQDILWRQLVIFLILSLLALVGGFLAFIPVLRRTLVPLSNMVDTVEQIDAGNLATRFPSGQGQVEIDRLAGSFNGMLERLELSFAAEKEAKEQMRRFVADASHELRTPLTSIHGFLEVLLRGAMNQPDKLNRSLNSMYAEAGRMKKLVEDLLMLAKLERTANIVPAEGDLKELILEMEPQLRLLAGERVLSLCLAEAKLIFDSDKMKQVILNLFINAVQHTGSANGRIGITLREVSGGIELVVQDNGPGIPEDHLPHVFEPFYRSESSRTRKSGGAGLGLAIAKSIIDLHQGSIRVQSALGEGSAFYVRLPV